MMKDLVRSLLLLAAIFGWYESTIAQNPAPARAVPAAKAEKFLRTELYFGRSKPDGTAVSEDEWNRFLAEVVTPRFPDGFTVLRATGQYREKGGKIIIEASEVLVFLYSRKTRTDSRLKLEEIRHAYLKHFDQESVMRVDVPKSVRVLF